MSNLRENLKIPIITFLVMSIIFLINCTKDTTILPTDKDTIVIDSNYYSTFAKYYDQGYYYFIAKDSAAKSNSDYLNILQPIPIKFSNDIIQKIWTLSDATGEAWNLISGYSQPLMFWNNFFVFEKSSDQEKFLISAYPNYFKNVSDVHSASVTAYNHWFNKLIMIPLVVTRTSFWCANCSCPTLFNPLYICSSCINSNPESMNNWDLHTYSITSEDWHGDDCEKLDRNCLQFASNDNNDDLELKAFQAALPNWQSSDSFALDDYYTYIGDEENPEDPDYNPPPKCKVWGSLKLKILKRENHELVMDEIFNIIRGEYQLVIELDDEYGDCKKTKSGYFLGVKSYYNK